MDPIRENLAWWSERAALHPASPMYAPWIAALERGEPVLFEPERRLLGDVRGQRLLHLPCHIGTDTLSWALLGAEVTGVDFSGAALAEASALARRLGLGATWVEADQCALPPTLTGFDAVVSTYGAVHWVYDLGAWAAGIARALAPGGRFVLVDGHPFASALDETAAISTLLPVRYAMSGGGPLRTEEAGSYAGIAPTTSHQAATCWLHGVAEIVTALLQAGLVLEALEELPWCVWPVHPDAVADGAGRWSLPAPWDRGVPLLLALRVRRPSLP